MSGFEVSGVDRIDATIEVPGDKSMSHRAAMIAGLAEGTSEIRGFLPSEDCVNTLGAMTACGVGCEVLEEMPGYGPTAMRIEGRAMRLAEPAGPIDCGNSGTGMRLLAGLLAGQDFESELFGDASLSGRPMGRIIKPLGEMGASIEARGEKEGCAPLRIRPARLKPIEYAMPVASAQVKSAILLAGMSCEGETVVIQPAPTRDHTERMLESFGVRVTSDGSRIALRGGQVPQARDFQVPGDVSSAAFWLVAAAVRPGSRITIPGLGLNPTRTAVIDVLRRMGAQIEIRESGAGGREPIGEVEVRGARLRGTTLERGEIPNLIDEIPVLAVAAALAEGRTVIRNARELRVKETDRIATVVANLRAMGGSIDEFDDGMEIEGGGPLSGAEVTSFGDHRIAMAFAIAGLSAQGTTRVTDTACVNTSYPGFATQLAAVVAGSCNPDDYRLPTRAVS